MAAIPAFKQPVLTQVSDRDFRLVEDYEYYWIHENTLYKIVVPAGFVTDIASVPRPAWGFILPTGLHTAAAVLHDFLYRTNKPSGLTKYSYYFRFKDDHWEDISYHQWSRKDCDRLFIRVMREAGTAKWKRRLMFLSVRLAGWWGWLG